MKTIPPDPTVAVMDEVKRISLEIGQSLIGENKRTAVLALSLSFVVIAKSLGMSAEGIRRMIDGAQQLVDVVDKNAVAVDVDGKKAVPVEPEGV